MTEAALVTRVWNDAHVLRRQGIPGEKGDITQSPERLLQTVRWQNRDHSPAKIPPRKASNGIFSEPPADFAKNPGHRRTSPAIFAATF